MQTLAALGAAHQANIIHRDIKPGNIFLTELAGGVMELVKLLDFGVAKFLESPVTGASSVGPNEMPMSIRFSSGIELTEVGEVVGTLSYMAPEQIRGEPVDARTDIYALGGSMYFALAGRRPFQAESAGALVRAIMNEEPPPLSRVRNDLSPGLVKIVERALSKDKERRFRTAQDMSEALSHLVRKGAMPTPSPEEAAPATISAMPAFDMPVSDMPTSEIAPPTAMEKKAPDPVAVRGGRTVRMNPAISMPARPATGQTMPAHQVSLSMPTVQQAAPSTIVAPPAPQSAPRSMPPAPMPSTPATPEQVGTMQIQNPALAQATAMKPEMRQKRMATLQVEIGRANNDAMMRELSQELAVLREAQRMSLGSSRSGGGTGTGFGWIQIAFVLFLIGAAVSALSYYSMRQKVDDATDGARKAGEQL
jgi:serine/threonine-protein kinase